MLLHDFCCCCRRYVYRSVILLDWRSVCAFHRRRNIRRCCARRRDLYSLMLNGRIFLLHRRGRTRTLVLDRRRSIRRFGRNVTRCCRSLTTRGVLDFRGIPNSSSTLRFRRRWSPGFVFNDRRRIQFLRWPRDRNMCILGDGDRDCRGGGAWWSCESEKSSFDFCFAFWLPVLCCCAAECTQEGEEKCRGMHFGVED